MNNWKMVDRETYSQAVNQYENRNKIVERYEVSLVESYTFTGEYFASAFYKKNCDPEYRVKENFLTRPNSSDKLSHSEREDRNGSQNSTCTSDS